MTRLITVSAVAPRNNAATHEPTSILTTSVYYEGYFVGSLFSSSMNNTHHYNAVRCGKQLLHCDLFGGYWFQYKINYWIGYQHLSKRRCTHCSHWAPTVPFLTFSTSKSLQKSPACLDLLFNCEEKQNTNKQSARLFVNCSQLRRTGDTRSYCRQPKHQKPPVPCRSLPEWSFQHHHDWYPSLPLAMVFL